MYEWSYLQDIMDNLNNASNNLHAGFTKFLLKLDNGWVITSHRCL